MTVGHAVFTFDTTHHAMWAEDVARDHDIPVEVVPAPPDGGARCGAALRVTSRRSEELAGLLQGEGILYRVMQGQS